MDIDEIFRYSMIKGLNLIGTGDFTHPEWFRELKTKLENSRETGLLRYKKKKDSPLRFMITGEVSTTFTFKGKTKKIHNLILVPSFEHAIQIRDRLDRYGNLSIDGRPVLNMSASSLVEEITEMSRENVIIPAHIWTPWFSLFGEFGGFEKIEDCYQDMTRHIFAVETGLSSDPPMNWRVSALDNYTLVSNSDSHSSWPWRLGREANVFDQTDLNYRSVIETLKNKDPKKFLYTIETYPQYGKYHWTGHRDCGISFPPKEAKKFRTICPFCRRQLTKGVEQRIDELSDRQINFRPEKAQRFLRLLPLSEIISSILGVSYPGNGKVWKIYNELILNFSNEYTVLINTSIEKIARIVDPRIANAILMVRQGKVNVVPGYDGVYGKIIFENENIKSDIKKDNHQENIESSKAKSKKASCVLTDFI